MMNLHMYIHSGILEAYTAGKLDTEKSREVEEMARIHPSVRQKLDELSIGLEARARSQAVQPPKMVKAMVMASIDFMERRNKGESPAHPPLLFEGSTVAEYDRWLQQKEFAAPSRIEDIYIRIIDKGPILTTAIVWMTEMQTEVHRQEIEQFLVVEGSCKVILDTGTRDLGPGDFMKINAGVVHRAVSNSSQPCKVILQRILI